MLLNRPDAIQIVLVEVPADHPLRREQRSATGTMTTPCG
jgi:hypothetical protein